MGSDLPVLPVRQLLAQRENRLEQITYWMRVGDTVATNAADRQILKVAYGLRGFITDGALVRISTVGLPMDRAYELEKSFIGDLLRTVDGETRRFLIGDPTKAINMAFESTTRRVPRRP